jgi:hypothetical protein
MATRTLGLFLACILVWIYVRHYATYAKGVEILQTSVTNPALSGLLQEKMPVVLNERVVDSQRLFATIFKYQYVFKSDRVIHAHPLTDEKSSSWNRSFARYLVLVPSSPSSHDFYVDVRHPRYPENTVRIKLEADRPVILPPGWLYRALSSGEKKNNRAEVRVHQAFDLIHLLLRPIASFLLK